MWRMTMKKSDLARTMLRLSDGLDREVELAVEEINLNYTRVVDRSNSETMEAWEKQKAMSGYLVMAAVAGWANKEVTKAKKNLDEITDNIEPVPSETVTIYDSGTLVFTKKQNKTGETTLLTDVLIGLARAGVDKELVDKVVADATEKKKGNVYYVVEATE